ncbi:UNVERIFIED_CONTAM: N-acetyltransferase [Streptococcus canis]
MDLDTSGLVVRKAEQSDSDTICALVQQAFEHAERSDGNEQKLVQSLRESESFVPELSLVAELGGTVVGHILFTKAKVDQHTVLVLAPLSVLPKYQKQGIDTVLVETRHKIATDLGYNFVIVLGSDGYYSRFGYISAESVGDFSIF